MSGMPWWGTVLVAVQRPDAWLGVGHCIEIARNQGAAGVGGQDFLA
jgi:hypothetical protein